MNRLATLFLIGLAGLLASCGSSVSSSTQAGTNDVYTVVVSPDQFTLNAGDWSSITATVELSNQNVAPKAVTPQPTIAFFSSDPRVSVSPAGEVCAGQWDTRYLTCTATVFPCLPDPVTKLCTAANAGQLDLPVGQVTITAFNASHNVNGTTIVTVHPRATSITLSAAVGTDTSKFQYPPSGCVSQNQQVQYSATFPEGSVFAANDYTWVVGDSNVASVSSFGKVIANNPGVTNVYAKLNGTVSTPLAFATCPPSSIVLTASPFTNAKPTGPFTTSDLDINPLTDPTCATAGTCVLNKGDQKFLTATLFDSSAHILALTLPLTYLTSDPLTGSISADLPLSSKLSANTSGRFSVMAACEPSTCNAAVADFVSPAGPISGKAVGFGFPIYSNAIGVTVQGTTSSTVLVTGTAFANPFSSVPPPLPHLLLAYDSESLTVTHTVALENLPNSLVVAPNGAKAYMGSSDGLMVLDLTTFQSSIHNFPVAGGINTDVVTGKVLGVSQDSRYVLVSDTSAPNPANQLVFLIDTTGTKVAARYTIPGIRTVTFAADGSNFWIGGDTGVYTFAADTFVPIQAIEPHDAGLSTHVNALAWMPDGQSYFASGDQLINYSTCDDAPNPQTLAGNPNSLSTTAIGGVPRVVGLSANLWYDYSVTTPAQVPNPTQLADKGNVCPPTVTVNAVNTPANTASSLQCADPAVSFSPLLEGAFVTGFPSVDGISACKTAESVIHGYDLQKQQLITLTTTSPVVPLSGGVLNDGRKLYFGTYESTSTPTTATLHRISLTTDPITGVITGTEDVVPVIDPKTGLPSAGTTVPASVEIVPSFVAVVPK